MYSDFLFHNNLCASSLRLLFKCLWIWNFNEKSCLLMKCKRIFLYWMLFWVVAFFLSKLFCDFKMSSSCCLKNTNTMSHKRLKDKKEIPSSEIGINSKSCDEFTGFRNHSLKCSKCCTVFELMLRIWIVDFVIEMSMYRLFKAFVIKKYLKTSKSVKRVSFSKAKWHVLSAIARKSNAQSFVVHTSPDGVDSLMWK
mgnify:CR=1 FL=1